MRFVGLDEAGRGPVLGPLVIAGVVIHEANIDSLLAAGLTDSKLLSKEKREQLFDAILNVMEDYKIVIIKAKDIDEGRRKASNLNRIEITKMKEILSELKNWDKAFVDACDKNLDRCQQWLQQGLAQEVVAEHFADLNYPVVSAASILAKVTRDKEIEKAHKQFGVDFGSGYPNDPKTISFLRKYFEEHKKMPAIARTSWQTIQTIIFECEQKTLDAFLDKTE
jgi:ribonuclease HII